MFTQMAECYFLPVDQTDTFISIEVWSSRSVHRLASFLSRAPRLTAPRDTCYQYHLNRGTMIRRRDSITTRLQLSFCPYVSSLQVLNILQSSNPSSPFFKTVHHTKDDRMVDFVATFICTSGTQSTHTRTQGRIYSFGGNQNLQTPISNNEFRLHCNCL